VSSDKYKTEEQTTQLVQRLLQVRWNKLTNVTTFDNYSMWERFACR